MGLGSSAEKQGDLSLSIISSFKSLMQIAKLKTVAIIEASGR